MAQQHDCESELVPKGYKCAEEILVLLADYHEAADTRLLRIAQNEYRNWNSFSPEVSPFCRLALIALQHRPEFFTYILLRVV